MSWSIQTPPVAGTDIERAIDAFVRPEYASDEQFHAAQTAAKALLSAIPLAAPSVIAHLGGHVGDSPSVSATVYVTRRVVL